MRHEKPTAVHPEYTPAPSKQQRLGHDLTQIPLSGTPERIFPMVPFSVLNSSLGGQGGGPAAVTGLWPGAPGARAVPASQMETEFLTPPRWHPEDSSVTW